MKWNVTPIVDNRTDGTSYTTRWLAEGPDDYRVHIQGHTRSNGEPGYYASVYRGTTSLAGRVYMPAGLVRGLRSGAVSIAECAAYFESILDAALKSALAQDMAHINADKARSWIENEASMMQFFHTPEDEPCRVETYRTKGGALVAREAHATDEGSKATRAEAVPRSDGTWYLERHTYSVCCDGPFDLHWCGEVRDGEIVELDAWQRDHFAEAAGY